MRSEAIRVDAGQIRSLIGERSRIIGALVMRELHTRYGRENVGFFWMMLEPVVFAFGVIAVRAVLAKHYEGSGTHGLPVIEFLMTGYLPFLLFRHVVQHSMSCLRSNHSVLYHRSVTSFDLFASRAIIEISGVVLAFWCGLGVCLAVGIVRPPVDILKIHIGFFFGAWFAIGFGLVVGALSEMAPMAEKLMQPIMYLAIMFSGCFYMADWLPMNIREPALFWIPTLHYFEEIRAGYFGDAVATHADLGYLAFVSACLTAAGLSLMMKARREVAVE